MANEYLLDTKNITYCEIKIQEIQGIDGSENYFNRNP
jgi:hypothetical protein